MSDIAPRTTKEALFLLLEDHVLENLKKMEALNQKLEESYQAMALTLGTVENLLQQRIQEIKGAEAHFSKELQSQEERVLQETQKTIQVQYEASKAILFQSAFEVTSKSVHEALTKQLHPLISKFFEQTEALMEGIRKRQEETSIHAFTLSDSLKAITNKTVKEVTENLGKASAKVGRMEFVNAAVIGGIFFGLVFLADLLTKWLGWG